MPLLSAVIAANVRAERARQQMRQVDLGERLGKSGPWVSDIETGRTTVHVDDLAPLCTGLGITLDVLLHGADRGDRRALGL